MSISYVEITNIFSKLKKIKNYDQLVENSIKIDGFNSSLICASDFYKNNKKIIDLLSNWRRDADTFHNKFSVTSEGTEKWYQELLLNVDDRILFFITHGNSFIGHLGFANLSVDDSSCSIELDNVIRGVKNIYPGLMSAACNALMNFAFEKLHMQKVILKTLLSNDHAINFYKNIGYKEYDRLPLKKVKDRLNFDHKIININDKMIHPDDYFVCMEIKHKND